jgi:hypothetical protein
MHTHAPGDLVKNAFKYSNEKNQDMRRALHHSQDSIFSLHVLSMAAILEK